MYRSPFDPLLPHIPRIYSISRSCERPRVPRCLPYSFTHWSASKINRCKLCEKPLRACREELRQRVQKKYDCLPIHHGVYYDCYKTFEELHPDTTEGEEEQEEEEEEEMIYQYQESEVSEMSEYESEDLPFEELPEVKKEAQLQSSVVTEEVFQENFTKSYYFEAFNRTERMPKLEEAMKDLMDLFHHDADITNEISSAYTPDAPAEDRMVVTKLWTSNHEFTKILNAGLVLDAVATFGEEVFKGAQFYENVLAEYDKSYKEREPIKPYYKEVIDKSIKYMRMLNTYIADLGSDANTEDRSVYRGVPANVLQRIETGETFRMVTWACASEKYGEAQKFLDGQTQTSEEKKKVIRNSMIKFNVKKGSKNSGKINMIGMSNYSKEMETLIPPYSASVCVKKEVIKRSEVNEGALKVSGPPPVPSGMKKNTRGTSPKKESKTPDETEKATATNEDKPSNDAISKVISPEMHEISRAIVAQCKEDKSNTLLCHLLTFMTSSLLSDLYNNNNDEGKKDEGEKSEGEGEKVKPTIIKTNVIVLDLAKDNQEFKDNIKVDF
ncbi:unnamed protein product [Moneuplotes crassus]|uniref:Uncharacterized protein n=1 Tax=Euplotes crassus TaxID=5936 RepID=A0AAD1XV64_EUPCR|nr:unnamed protein product [Moneuplotes crassus]